MNMSAGRKRGQERPAKEQRLKVRGRTRRMRLGTKVDEVNSTRSASPLPKPIPRPERIRDPLHNLIEFGTDQFEHVIWQVIQTRAFQRLRRIVGHGMFSHAFEDVGKKLGITMAQHEHVSDLLIREDGEIKHAFHEMGSGFANDVAAVLKLGRPGNLYDSVVSSQFDADRLDYMQRDRLMTGLQNSGIDFTWLMANLEIGKIKTGVDEEEVGEIETFILGYHFLCTLKA